jgi:FKBP-type peptidyl-prolyl cis-trans isomerase FkpA
MPYRMKGQPMRLPASRRQGRTTIGFLAVTAATLCAGIALAQQPPAATDAAAAPPAKKSAAKAAAPAARSPSYSLGVSMGTQLKNNGVTADSVNTVALGEGVRDALSGKTELSDADQTNIQQLITKAASAGAEANHKAAAKFLAENGKKPGVITTASGLEYKVLSPGSGTSPGPTDEVTVNYRGTLLDGKEFDSSYKRHEPAKFPLNHVIQGWSEGVALMKPGAKYQFWVPPQLAYDTQSPPGIPPGSLLVFEVELLGVKPAAPAAATPAPAK